MRLRINWSWPAFAALLLLVACTSFESEYEKAVYDDEPVYCYQTLGGVDCHRKPHHRDGARLVNYYGPAPGKYKPPKPPKENSLRAPPEVEAAADGEPKIAPNTDANAPGGPESKTEAAEAKSEWKEWLPLVSVAFGALQVVAAFAL